MRNKTLYTSFIFIIVGITGIAYNAYYTNRYSYTTADGSLVLQETLGLPLGMIMLIFGIVILLIWAVKSGISYLRVSNSTS